MTKGTAWIGTSGWSYDHWAGVLYPPGLPVAKRLERYVERYRTVEVNSTFYHWPRDTTFAGWHQRLPPGFLLSVKAPRALTHSMRLRDPERWLEIAARGLALLKQTLGVFLAQLPPDLEYDYERLAYFLEAASGVGRSASTPDTEHPTPNGEHQARLAVEFRHPSWNREETFALLEQHSAAYCVMSGAQLPCLLRATAPFVYVRMHGPDTRSLYAGSYSDTDLRWWRDRIAEWQSAGKDVFVYFNNDGEGNAVRNADTLIRLLGS